MAGRQDYISVQEQDFDQQAEYQALIRDNPGDGAVVTFTGLVRNQNQGKRILSLTLEHYPAMTKKSLEQIVQQARSRWPLGRVRLIHRIGRLELGQQIVFVGVSSTHRQAAFEACEYIMDYLKTRAPFWKKEQTEEGDHWVEARDSDHHQAGRW